MVAVAMTTWVISYFPEHKPWVVMWLLTFKFQILRKIFKVHCADLRNMEIPDAPTKKLKIKGSISCYQLSKPKQKHQRGINFSSYFVMSEIRDDYVGPASRQGSVIIMHSTRQSLYLMPCRIIFMQGYILLTYAPDWKWAGSTCRYLIQGPHN